MEYNKHHQQLKNLIKNVKGRIERKKYIIICLTKKDIIHLIYIRFLGTI